MCEDPDPEADRVVKQPLAGLRWVKRDRLVPNEYNPNHVAPPELALLRLSILEDGWTQPIVAFELVDDPAHRLMIIDGEHRWKTSADPDVAALTGGRVPVVVLTGSKADRMIATIRHNRARGEHGVLPMAVIVGDLFAEGLDSPTIERRLQMEDEEVMRLTDRSGMPTHATTEKAGFSPGWVPGHE